MKSTEIRKKFIDYFVKQGHTAVPSSSLIPEDDPTLLFTNAGMNQFKNSFLGIDQRPYKRAVSVQKVVRAGGKHNDLENVGFTARHHTFFEMLGNFSFGDYFKKDAIHFAWEVLTKEFGIPKEKLYVTVFETDDEAADIWHKQEGVPRDRIFRLGEKDNFWRMGDTGPCGPSSEIFYDHGPSAGQESDPYKGILSGEDRYVELWNLVFMQFYEKQPGVLDPLPKPSVDTGSGFERVVAALQGKLNNFDTDLFAPMIQRVCDAAKMEYVTDVHRLRTDAKLNQRISAVRVMADHCRSTSLLIADGALPSNEGRGYVLRRIVRRAIRYARELSDTQSLFLMMVEEFIKMGASSFPELEARKKIIMASLQDEEERFVQTLGSGNQILFDEIEKLRAKGAKIIPGEIAFRLYDTFGFPLDLTDLIAKEKGFSVDETRFHQLFEDAKKIARASWKGRGLEQNEAHMIEWSGSFPATKFTGYEGLNQKAKILGLSNGEKMVNELATGAEGLAVVNQTSLYAEGGGQIGDRGLFHWPDGEAEVVDCFKRKDTYIHRVRVTKGSLKAQQNVDVIVTDDIRRDTAANHSATHLMHAALRKVLGTHVTQAGSLVDAEKLRFDFTHAKALSPDEIAQIESLVQQEIFHATTVEAKVMKHKEALEAGAMALFGEKYGDEVRVLRMGNFSCELCGGIHVSNTSQIRLFKIVSEGGVSAGVRRIEALTGRGAIAFLEKNFRENQEVKAKLNLQEGWTSYVERATLTAPVQVQVLKDQLKALEGEIRKLKGSQIDTDSLVSEAKAFRKNGVDCRVVLANIAIEERELLSQIGDQLISKLGQGLVILVGQGGEQKPVLVSVTKSLSPKIHAGQLLKSLAEKHGGKGGGRPDFAQGALGSTPSWGEVEAWLNGLS